MLLFTLPRGTRVRALRKASANKEPRGRRLNDWSRVLFRVQFRAPNELQSKSRSRCAAGSLLCAWPAGWRRGQTQKVKQVNSQRHSSKSGTKGSVILEYPVLVGTGNNLQYVPPPDHVKQVYTSSQDVACLPTFTYQLPASFQW
jgi:hypothetical protein